MGLEIDVEAFKSHTLGFELPNKWFVQVTVDENGVLLEVLDGKDELLDSEEKTWDEFMMPDDDEEDVPVEEEEQDEDDTEESVPEQGVEEKNDESA